MEERSGFERRDVSGMNIRKMPELDLLISESTEMSQGHAEAVIVFHFHFSVDVVSLYIDTRY